MSKKANGEGTIYRRADGRWCASLSLPDGRRKSFYGKTRKEAHQRLNAALKSQSDGLPIPGERETLAAYLQEWLKTVRPTLKPSTWHTYEANVRNHITPCIGTKRLARLEPTHLQKLYAECLENGLSPMTVRHIHALVHKALSQAARWGRVSRNVADLVDAPKATRHEMKTLTAEESRRLFEAVAGDRLEALYVLAITTGMRRGELLGLHWHDVDLDRGSLQVRTTAQRVKGQGIVLGGPKTKGSRRQIDLAGRAVTALRRHKVAQAEERLEMGPSWQDQGLVFPNEVGKLHDGRNILARSFRPLLKRADLPEIRFHDLRHTSATLLMAEGIHPKVVSERLGHSQISTTLDLYSHVTPTMQRQAADALDAVLG